MDGILFQDRIDAGRRLAERYPGPTDDMVVFGIARGGVPVAYPIASRFNAVLDVITVRKLPIPWSPEMGFGAIAPDGTSVLNERVVRETGLSSEEIERISAEVLSEVHRREAAYRGGRALSPMKDMNVALVDDGLATGYTMIAAIEMASRQGARHITAAVPVSPADTAQKIKGMVDELEVLEVVNTYSFAVASFYRDFHDMADSEVLDYLQMGRDDSAGTDRG